MILSGSSFNRLSSQMMTVSAENDEVPEWVVIQMSTFTNWLNYQLRSSNVSIQNLTEDLADGTLLIQIVEIFQQRICTGKIYNNNPTEIQCLMNVQMALDALRESGIKLINIGSQDIVGKNLKLVLGLIWCLIQKYQIAITSKIPPKKLIMAWLQSVLPEFKLTNFRTSWNDGKALAALIDYCQPGLFSNWRELDPRNSFNNCQKCLTLAEKYLNVPALLNPEHLSSSELDELSTITYLSFFVAEGGPGYVSSLRNCSRLMPDVRVMDFDKSWNDGYLLCRLVQAVGGYIPDFEEMNFGDPSYFVRNMGRGLQAALDIGIASLLGPEDLADSDVEYLGIMALGAAICSIVPIIHTEPTSPHITSKLTPIQEQHYESSAIYSQTHPPTPPPPNTTTPSLGISTSCYQDQQLNLDLSFQHDSDLTISDLDVVVIGPNNRVKDHRTLQLSKIETEKGAVLSFVPDQVGLFQVRILCQGSELPSSPILLSVLEGPPSSEEEDSFAEHSNREQPYQVVSQEPIDYQASKAFLEKEMNKRPNHHHQDVARVSFSGLSEPCSVGSIVEVVINAQGTNESDECLVVESMSPSGKTYQCNISRSLHSYIATFSPNEVGSWHIGIFYNDDHIHGSPFACEVYDANKVEVYGLDVGLVGQELRFVINTQQAGHGHIFMNISKNGKSIPYELEKDNGPGVYKAMFIPDGAGQYKIGIKFNDCEIKGSSFLLDVADSTSFSVYGDNLKMAAVDRLSTFMIHASNAECKDITVFITG
uniref:Calponin-homology (CH) domain-containing protein n=1 Tax=Rhabditophanes sp. KR3021 TaxID=114890 RepID=A0AC35TTY3_9BILA